MRKKSIILFLICFMFSNIATIGIVFIPSTNSKSEEFPNYQPIDLSWDIENRELPLKMEDREFAARSLSCAAGPGDIGDIKLFVSTDYYNSYQFLEYFKLRAVGEDVEIWVQLDIGWGIGDPPMDDPRTDPIITDEECQYLADQYDSNIGPTVTNYFGMPEERLGWNAPFSQWFDLGPDYYYDEDGKTLVLVSNIRDNNYYDYTYPYYIIGVFSPSIQGYFDRNVVSLDAAHWDEILGPPDHAYEATLAHEFQHLIHHDYFEESALWMNEGCSTFSEILCGYPTPWNDINSFFATPDNSLIEWEDQGNINVLADYGQALLWATYLVDNYGDEFLKDYVTNGVPGVPGIEALLPEGVSFDRVFQDWTLSNLMRTGYTRIDFNYKELNEVRTYEVKDKWPTDIYGTDFGNTITILDYDTGISRVGTYGTDYILLSKLKWQYGSELRFDGAEFAWTPHWDKDGTAWYSSRSEPLSALDLFVNVELSGSSVLSFDTFYDIEAFWDFAFVQISFDGGLTWNSLSNEYTTDEDPNETYPDIVANFPGLTGKSDGWISMNFVLPEYTGEAIIRFRYMTDWGTEWNGWWVDNVAIDGSTVSEDNFWIIYEPPTTSFMVSVLRQDFWDGEFHYNLISEFDLSGDNNFVIDLAPFLSFAGEDLRYPDVLLVISPRVGVSDYSFSVAPI
ncbi:MAG: hypothetical protein ACFFDF_00875 [Candidatus Odinarchaeota archaeon]